MLLDQRQNLHIRDMGIAHANTATATSLPRTGRAENSAGERPGLGAITARRYLLAAGVVACDSLVIIASMLAAFFLRFGTGLFDFPVLFSAHHPEFETYIGLFSFGFCVLAGLLAAFGAYEIPSIVNASRAPLPILKALFWWSCIYLGASLALKLDPPVSRVYILLTLVLSALGLIVVRAAVLAWIKRSNPAWLHPRILFVGCSPESGAARAFISHTVPEPASVEWLNASIEGSNPQLGSMDQLTAYPSLNQIDLVVIDHNSLPMDRVIGLAAECERKYINYNILPGYTQVFASKFRVEDYGPVAVLAPKVLPLDLWRNRAVKRAVDIGGALAGFILTAPLTILLICLIKIISPGPAFFSQVRYGRRGLPFKMLKFRTMHPGSEAHDNAHLSTKDSDPRLLPIGPFLRRWNLDELPQFWNVLRGDMSLVGPRPERVFHANRLADEIVHYQFRHSIKPGMTGWAQANGLRGDTDFQERIRHDIHYIENWSPMLDVQIILMTLFRRWVPKPWTRSGS
jgi:exopolysaccharide biosynthesis polyprenyl glycosylphosphotransferase